MSRHAEHVRNKKILRQEQREKRHNEKVSQLVSHTSTNVHHILCKARRKDYNVEIDENKDRISRVIHDDYHHEFGLRTPQEVVKLVLYVVGKVLKPESYALLDNFTKMDERDCYVDGAVR